MELNQSFGIDYKEIWSLLRPDCVICNWAFEVANGTQCKKCPFISGSWSTGKNLKKKLPRPGCGVKFTEAFQHLNLVFKNCIGKHQLFYFLYHPELKFKYPEIPEQNFLGDDRNAKNWFWILHHTNGNFWDDRKFNLMLCLCGAEHLFFEKLTKQAKKIMFSKELTFIR
jgi:hypothetical protein